MKKKVMVRLGDIFCVMTRKGYKKYFQYVTRDTTCLNTQVIRVFQKSYHEDEFFDSAKVTKDAVAFYAHVVIRHGLQANLWHKVGHNVDCGDTKNIMFRHFEEIGWADIKKSYRWFVWKVNGPRVKIGELTQEYKEKADWGLLFPYHEIYHRIVTGEHLVKAID